MALGVMAVANRLRLNVPETLSVAGFDDTPGAKVVWPQLTTVRQPIAAMAGAAADMLLNGVSWEDGALPPSKLLDFELVIRESTGPAAR
jgi:LacI family transcriptional regulator